MNNPDVIEEIVKLIRRTNRKITQSEKKAVTFLGLSPSHAKILTRLDRNSPVTAGQLSVKCGLSKSAVSEILNTLEKKGLVERVRCESDRRKHHISLTSHGSLIKSAILPGLYHKEIAEKLEMTELEKKLLYILLKKFYNQIT